TKSRWAEIGAIVVFVAIGLVIYQFYVRGPAIEPASVEKMAYPLPDKPSIAVLPFINISDDPKQEYLCDGLTEEIITALSKVRNMFVIARNSTFNYKGKAVKIQQVAEELGVRYVLEGSIQKSRDRLRINAQLIDAVTGHHLWAERYDRKMEDIFTIQDKVTKKILTALQVEIAEGEDARLWGRGTNNLEAYLKLLQARQLNKKHTKEDNSRAQQLIKEAIELDSQYAMAWRYLGATYVIEHMMSWSKFPEQSLKRAKEMAQKAIALDDTLAEAYALLGRIYLGKGQYEKAIAEGEKAYVLDPNSAHVLAALAYSLQYSGKPKEAIEYYQKAIRLDPIPPSWYTFGLGRAYRDAGQFEDAITTFKKLLHHNRFRIWAYVSLTATYSLAGRAKEARALAAEALNIDPKLTTEYYINPLPYKDRNYKQSLIEALRKAGLPYSPPLPLPDKPSIAVLAFDNLSADPEQEYFSDGIADDLITDLSKISGLFVVAQNSTFAFKGQHKKVQQIGKELGVRYVLEGSVRKYKDKVRINAQLIDAQTGGHLWAERYDRDFKDIFALQDEVINKIVSALSVKLSSNEKGQVGIQKTVNMKAYDYYLRGMNIIHDWTGDQLSKAKSMFEQAIKHDPNFAHAYAAHAMANHFIYRMGGQNAGITRHEARDEAHEYVNKAIGLNPNLSTAYSVLGILEFAEGNFDKAVDYSRKAVELDPNYPEGYVVLGYIQSKAGNHKAGLETLQKAFRLDPIPPHYYHLYLGHVQVNNKLYQEAIESIKKAGPNTTQGWRHDLLVSHAYLDEMDKAKSELEKILTAMPRMNIFWALVSLNFKQDEDKAHWTKAYRKVGLPETPFTYEGDEKNILSKEEMLDLIVDKTLTGIDPEEGQLWMHYSKDGTFRYTGYSENSGKYWLEGNRLGQSYKKHPGYVDYVFFYRNPNGSFEDKNEYDMFFPFQGTLPVSVEK
ncbi:MAG: tetratricopeptide repeat protein, partial [Desulfobacterales bacterium]